MKAVLVVLVFCLSLINCQSCPVFGNIALHKPVQVSSHEHTAAFGNDGNCSTFWYSDTTQEQNYTVDLQSVVPIGNLVLTWRYPPLLFKVQYSIDGSYFIDRITVTVSSHPYEGGATLNLGGARAQFIRLQYLKRDSQSAEIRELEIYPFIFPTPPEITI